MIRPRSRQIEILLVEESPSDAELTIEFFREGKVSNRLSHVEDGVQALGFLRRQGEYSQAPRPDLVLLELNLPRMNGREVLVEVSADPDLQAIPVVVMTSSRAEHDGLRAHKLEPNCFITKPVDLEQFHEMLRAIESFWLYVVTLPPRTEPASRAPVARPN
jgi:two-component system, chemotaxis family, response regulator Rcp1